MGNTFNSNQRYPVYDEDEMQNGLIPEDAGNGRSVTYICDCFSSRKENPKLSLHRAMNLRAELSTDHIKDLKQELRRMDFAANDMDSVTQSADIESYDQDEKSMDEKHAPEAEEAEYIKHQIQSIESTKKELEDELNELKSKESESANKTNAFGCSLAIDILQESLDAEDAKQRQLICAINKSI